MGSAIAFELGLEDGSAAGGADIAAAAAADEESGIAERTAGFVGLTGTRRQFERLLDTSLSHIALMTDYRRAAFGKLDSIRRQILAGSSPTSQLESKGIE